MGADDVTAVRQACHMPLSQHIPSRTTVRFHRIYPAAIAPVRVDPCSPTAMPTAVFRRLEAMRKVSSLGWHAFAAEDVHLRWNGSEVFVRQEDQWRPLLRSELPGIAAHWNERVPAGLADLAPPFLTSLESPGLVQIWTGLLCTTAPGWNLLVRPPSHLHGSALLAAHEGLIEADRFKACPLFMNIQLTATDVDIHLPRAMPLLQVQALLRENDEGSEPPPRRLMAWEWNWTASRA